jgi:hypothetical protein
MACCNALRHSWTGTRWTETVLLLFKCRKRIAASRNTLVAIIISDYSFDFNKGKWVGQKRGIFGIRSLIWNKLRRLGGILRVTFSQQLFSNVTETDWC